MTRIVERLPKEDRTHYLHTQYGHGQIVPGLRLFHQGIEAKVTTWKMDCQDRVEFALRLTGVTVAAELEPEEARLIAQALTLAAEDAERVRTNAPRLNIDEVAA